MRAAEAVAEPQQEYRPTDEIEEVGEAIAAFLDLAIVLPFTCP